MNSFDVFVIEGFTVYNWNSQKKRICANLHFFADSQSRAEELSGDASFIIFGHQTWD